jgi:hypothetical protein
LTGDADDDTAFYSLAVFTNLYVFEAGAWRILEMRLFPVMRTDYDEGWAKSVIVTPPPAEAQAPDRPVPEADRMTAGAVPAFFAANPVTGEAVQLPEPMHAVGTERLPTGPRAARVNPPTGTFAERIAEAERKLAMSKAWDGAENVSAAYGDYLDDLDFGPLAAIFAVEGNKQIPFTGFYITRASIAARDQGRGTQTQTTPRPRTSLPLHLRTQPVIHVAADGRSAVIRTRLFQPPS